MKGSILLDGRAGRARWFEYFELCTPLALLSKNAELPMDESPSPLYLARSAAVARLRVDRPLVFATSKWSCYERCRMLPGLLRDLTGGISRHGLGGISLIKDVTPLCN